MKLLESRRATAVVTVPVRGDYAVHFQGGKAAAPDDVADYLVAVSGGFYTHAGNAQDVLGPDATVLVIRDGGLGDVLLAAPLCRKLAATGATVDFQTRERYRSLFYGNQSVRATFALEEDIVRPEQYSVVLDLRLVVENSEAAGIHEHRADAFAQFGEFTLTEEERRPDFWPSPEEIDGAKWLKDQSLRATDSPLIAYVWRSSTDNRNWSEAAHAANLVALSNAGYTIWVLDDQEQDVPIVPGVVNLTGELTLREAAAALWVASAVITPDTGLFHLAAATATPTVAYFGAFPATERQAHKSLTVFQNAGACALSPCRSYRCFNRDEHDQARCLSIAPDLLVAKIEALLTAQKE